MPREKFPPSISAAAFFSAMASEPAANTIVHLAAVDHRLQIVELVGLQPAEDDQLRGQAAHHRPANSAASYAPSATRCIAAGTTTLDASRLPADRASWT